MNFCFNFGDEENLFEKLEHSNQEVSTVVELAQPFKVISLPVIGDSASVHAISISIGSHIIHRVQASSIHLDENSDIISGVYEGGNKVWECSLDLTYLLLDTIQNNNCIPLPIPDNCKVIELGCGHGLPGIAALKLGFSSVMFADLNEEVLLNRTWPNIILNCPDQIFRASCVSGDWDNLSLNLFEYSEGSKIFMEFDVVLASETLYSPCHCKKFVLMLERHLSITGVAIIATKRYYFGVGGGTIELERHLELSSTNFKLSYLKQIQDGASNIREILEIRKC
eukprot:gene14658-19693_t